MPERQTPSLNFSTAGLPAVTLALLLAAAPAPAAEPQPVAPAETPRRLFQVTLHTPAELENLLTRAERLAKTSRPADRRTGIALVLHGPEVEIFARRNYSMYRHIVDLAARLDSEGVIEVKMCQTEMRARGIGEQEVPGFVEFVPYGPDEEARLRRRGYVYF